MKRDWGARAAAGARGLIGALAVYALCCAPAVSADTAAEVAAVEQQARAGIPNAKPLLDALERYKAANGRYPQYVDNLMPAHFTIRPRPSAEGVFIYDGAKEQTFEVSFLIGPSPAQHLIKYSPTQTYPARIDEGPYVWTLAGKVDGWARYRLGRQQTVAILNQWNGRVPTAPDTAPAVITDRATLEKLWGAWQITAPLPRIDFSNELVLTHVARSSLTRFMGFTLDDKGDLVPQIVATPDMPGFSSYAICVIKRAGIKTVRGQPLK
jgi:hypothetical protein